MYQRLVESVIASIKVLPDNCRQSGDDSKLKDVWDEFKYQLQEEQSSFFGFYEDTIRRLCAEAITRQGREWKQLLWLWTEGYTDQWVEQDEVSIEDFVTDDIVEEVYNRVCDIAANEPFATDPDEERDREDYEEDMDLFRSHSEDAGDDDSDPGEAK
jgi:hypothetical protein